MCRAEYDARKGRGRYDDPTQQVRALGLLPHHRCDVTIQQLLSGAFWRADEQTVRFDTFQTAQPFRVVVKSHSQQVLFLKPLHFPASRFRGTRIFLRTRVC